MPAVEVVRAIAQALDADDFARVAALLDDDCTYDTGRATLRGPRAIVAAYAEASAWGRTNGVAVRYTSELEPAAGAEVAVRFTDDLEHAGRRHRHVCRQTFTVGPRERVIRIVHHELPGEREALAAWFAAGGLAR